MFGTLFLPLILGYKNITYNAGILPINLGPATLQRSSHTVVHYYSLKPLLEELHDLQEQYNTLQSNIKDKPSLRRDISNQNKIILHLQLLISSKLDNINNTLPVTRSKRALYDNVGSLIKFATGNLDSSDGDRYDKILKDLDSKNNLLQNQIELQYSLTQEAIKRFDNTVKNIEHNEANLKFKIQQLVNITDTAINFKELFNAKDVYSQLIFLYNSILSILQDLENALTFCKLRTYHPSILRLNDLILHINKMKQTRNLIISPDEVNMPDFQKSIEVDCKIEHDRVSFFLSFPINYETVFELFYLLPIPTLNGQEYCTIIPNSKYYLKSNNNIVKALNGPCILGKPHQCLQKNVNVNGNACERDIMLHGSTKSCEYVKLYIKDNHFEFIPEINQYLAILPITESLRIESLDNNEIKELQGIFLIEPNKGKLYFRDNTLYFQTKSVGKPTLLSSTVNNSKYSNVKLQLNKLNLEDLNSNQVANLETKYSDENIYENKPWKTLECLNLFILIMLVISLVVRKYFWESLQKLWKSNPIDNNHSPNPEVNITLGDLYPKVSLPADAKI